MISDFIGGFLKIVQKPKYDDTTIDRLHYHWSFMLLAIMSMFIGTYQYAGKPIHCWYPAEFKKWWAQYGNQYCFVENTYFVPMTLNLPMETDVRKESEITYYQWVPFILAIQALLFYVPHMIWRALNWQSGIDVKKFVTMAVDISLNKGKREDDIDKMSKHLLAAIDYKRDLETRANPLTWLLHWGKKSGVYVTISFLLAKVLSLANVIGQLFLLNSFLGPQYHWWGIGIVKDLINGTEWHTSGHFPRVTMCDFEVRDVGQMKTWTVQCVLWINMLNEKIFLFIWFWLVLLSALTILDLVYYLFVSFASFSRVYFIRRHLRARNLVESREDPYPRRFAIDKLGVDGVLVLRLVEENAGYLVTTDVIDNLYGRYKPSQKGPNGAFRPRNVEEFREVDSDHLQSDSVESTPPPGYTWHLPSDTTVTSIN